MVSEFIDTRLMRAVTGRVGDRGKRAGATC